MKISMTSTFNGAYTLNISELDAKKTYEIIDFCHGRQLPTDKVKVLEDLQELLSLAIKRLRS